MGQIGAGVVEALGDSVAAMACRGMALGLVAGPLRVQETGRLDA